MCLHIPMLMPIAIIQVLNQHHFKSTGMKKGEIERVLGMLRAVPPGTGRVLLAGRPSAHERWDLARLAPLFRRWT